MSEKAGELVKDLMARYTGREPKTISVKLSWDGGSEIRISGDGLDEKDRVFSHHFLREFAEGVIEAYEEVYGKLRVVPVSLREEIYENDKVSLDLYP